MLKPSPEKLLSLGMSFWNAKALLSAVEQNGVQIFFLRKEA